MVIMMAVLMAAIPGWRIRSVRMNHMVNVPATHPIDGIGAMVFGFPPFRILCRRPFLCHRFLCPRFRVSPVFRPVLIGSP